MKTVCVYCGSSDKMSETYLLAARAMGAAIAKTWPDPGLWCRFYRDDGCGG